MRDSEKSLSLESLNLKIERVIDKLVSDQKKTNRQKTCLDSSLASVQKPWIGIEFLETKFKSMIGYLLLLHYYPMEKSVFCYVYLDLQDLIEETESFWLSALIKHKSFFLRWLIEQTKLSEQQFFSGICNKKELDRLFNTIKFRFEEKLRRPKRPVWRKGYRDKGSLPGLDLSVRRDELSKDWYLSQLQLIFEERHLSKSAITESLSEYLAGRRVLTDDELMLFYLKERSIDYEIFRKSEIETYIAQRGSRQHQEENQESRDAKRATSDEDL